MTFTVKTTCPCGQVLFIVGGTPPAPGSAAAYFHGLQLGAIAAAGAVVFDFNDGDGEPSCPACRASCGRLATRIDYSGLDLSREDDDQKWVF